MKKRTLVWITGVVALLLAAAIGLRIMQAQRAKAAVAERPAVAAVLELTPQDISELKRLDLQRVVAFSGGVRAAQSAFVKAKVAGEIKSLTVREGDSVRAGQVLVQQDTTEFDWRVRQADQQAQAARAQLEIAKRTLANNRALVEQGFISATALESSASTEAGAQANLLAANAGVELARKAMADAVLKAPISGIVSQRLVQPGERVSVDARILEIVDLSTLEIEASLAPEDVARLRAGQKAQVQVDGISSSIGARVARISPSAHAGSRTVPVYLALDRHPALRHGLFARGRIELDHMTALALPASAVRLDRAEPYVWLLDGGRIHTQPLTLGQRATSADGAEYVEVQRGLVEGARVLSGTVSSVAEGAAWKPAPAGPAQRRASDSAAPAASPSASTSAAGH